MFTEISRIEGDNVTEDEHKSVARYVLVELLNDREGGTAFVEYYSDYRDGHRRVPLRFAIMAEHTGRNGQPVRPGFRRRPPTPGSADVPPPRVPQTPPGAVFMPSLRDSRPRG